VTKGPTANDEPNVSILVGRCRTRRLLRGPGLQASARTTSKASRDFGEQVQQPQPKSSLQRSAHLSLTLCPSPARTRSSKSPRRKLPESLRSPGRFVKPPRCSSSSPQTVFHHDGAQQSPRPRCKSNLPPSHVLAGPDAHPGPVIQ